MQERYSFDYLNSNKNSSEFIDLWIALRNVTENIFYIYNISDYMWKKYRLKNMVSKYNSHIFNNSFKDYNDFIDFSTVVFGHIQLFIQKAFSNDIISTRSFFEIREILNKLRDNAKYL
jgi:hypothetical protein